MDQAERSLSTFFSRRNFLRDAAKLSAALGLASSPLVIPEGAAEPLIEDQYDNLLNRYNAWLYYERQALATAQWPENPKAIDYIPVANPGFNWHRDGKADDLVFPSLRSVQGRARFFLTTVQLDT